MRPAVVSLVSAIKVTSSGAVLRAQPTDFRRLPMQLICAARAATRAVNTPTTDATFAVASVAYFATHDKQCFVI